jgi:hypothetical protein
MRFADVTRLAQPLPDIEVSTSYGTPALKVGGKLIARLKEDGESLVLRTDFLDREFLMRTRPETFFITEHYRGYPWVLVRLAMVSEGQLAELLDDAWRRVAGTRAVRARDGELAVPTRRLPRRRTKRR